MSAQRENDEALSLKVERYRFTAKRAGARCGGQGCPRSRRQPALFYLASRYKKNFTTETQRHGLKPYALQAVSLCLCGEILPRLVLPLVRDVLDGQLHEAVYDGLEVFGLFEDAALFVGGGAAFED